MSTVAIVGCIYGEGYGLFLEQWQRAIGRLHRRPDEVVMVDGRLDECPWKHPQAYWLNAGAAHASSEWLWFVDVDDLVLPSGLDGIDALTLETDVWLAGFVDSNGRTHVPTALPNLAYQMSSSNGYPAGSFVRRSAFESVGGFDDIAFQDWGLWRKLAAAGAGFRSSGRVNYRRRLHPAQRTVTELATDRIANMEAMQWADTNYRAGRKAPC